MYTPAQYRALLLDLATCWDRKLVTMYAHIVDGLPESTKADTL